MSAASTLLQIPRALMRPLRPAPVAQSVPPWARTAPGEQLAPVVVPVGADSYGLKVPSEVRDYQDAYAGLGGPRWIYACVSAVAQDVAALDFFPADAEGARANEWPHIALAKPNREDTFHDLIEHTVLDLLLTAQAFHYLDRSGEMFRIQPDEVRLFPGADGFVSHYEVQRSGGIKALPAEVVRRTALPNPRDRYTGTGPSQALRHTFQIAHGEDLYLLNFYRRGARPSGFISFDADANWDDVERAIDKFKDEHAGQLNHGKVGALVGGAKFQKTSLSPIEGGYVEVQALTKAEVLSLYGVPPFRIGDLEHANYANAREQERVYFSNTVLPMARRIVRSLNAWPLLVPEPSRLRIAIDEDAILQRYRDEGAIATAASTAVAGGILTRDEARSRFYSLGSIEADVPETGPVQAPMGLLLAPAAEARGIGETPDYVRALEGRRHRSGRRIARAARQTLARVWDQVQGALSKRELPADVEQALLDLDFSWISEDVILEWMPEILDALDAEAQVQIELTGIDPSAWDVQHPDVLKFVEERGKGLGDLIGQETADKVQHHVKAALEDGESIDQLQKRLEQALGPDATAARAERIARTEETIASNVGTQRAYEQAQTHGANIRKRWLTVGDGNVRDSHAAANGSVVDVADAFTVGGVRMAHPGDPGAPPEEIINCRCTVVPVRESE